MTDYKNIIPSKKLAMNYVAPVTPPSMGMRMELGGPSARQELRMKISPPIANTLDDVAFNAEKLQGRNYKTLTDVELEKIEKYLTE